MTTITIPKNFTKDDLIVLPRKVYVGLLKTEKAYTQLLKVGHPRSMITPPTKSRSAVLNAFKKSGKYNTAFLKSFEKGLKRSSYFTGK